MKRLIALPALALALSAPTAHASTAKAPAVCGKLATSKIAAQQNRVKYLTSLLPAARHAGFGIGPLLTLEVAALKSKHRAAAARYLVLLGKACQRAN